ncbi:MAG: YggS family pyridoxal phosphate-dependent enzyme, partial [Clostridia bacterium]|nr:YggS family pyridoxal phosphate-dependent enzyme [Clostridia bacterium]
MVWLSDEERFSAIEENLKIISNDVAEAAIRSGRSFEDIALMAVTKTVEPKFINKAIECGISLIGENKVQEFLLKESELNLASCKAHLIGHLQSNKAKDIVGKVEMIESVHSLKLAKLIGKLSEEKGIVTDILLEVN